MNRKFYSLITQLSLISMLFSVFGAPIPIGRAAPSFVDEEHPRWTLPHPVLSDVRIRQAIAFCTDRLALLRAAYSFLTPEQEQSLLIDTFLPKTHWAYKLPAEEYPYNPTLGQQYLEQAGWTLQPGATYRTNAEGKELAFTLTTTTASYRERYVSEMVKQLEACGIRLTANHAPSSWWSGSDSGLVRREFELGSYASSTPFDIASSAESSFTCDQIPHYGNNWEGENYMGWCNERASAAAEQADRAWLRQEVADQLAIVQEEYAKDMVTLDLFQVVDRVFAFDVNLQGLSIFPGDVNYLWNVQDWEIASQGTLTVSLENEPASLFELDGSSQETSQVLALINGTQVTTHNWEVQPRLLKQVATLENGLATTSIVEVSEGQRVIDANDGIVSLDPGDQLIDANGNLVKFTGEPVQMRQLTVPYEFLDGLTWSDGQPLKQEDFELYYKIACDPSLRNKASICRRIQTITFSDHGYTITWLPGYQEMEYPLPQFGWFPAHRLLSDGRRLSDVPASEWIDLPEVTQNPIGVGPYVLSEWVKGSYMSFSANPYFVSGPPKIPTIVFIVAPADKNLLLAGQVDLLNPFELNSVSQDLRDAEQAGTIKISIIPEGSREYMMYNLEIPIPPKIQYLPILVQSSTITK